MKETTEASSNLSTSDFMATFLDRHKPPQEAIDHFASIPWMNKWLQDPAYKLVPTFSRHLKSSGEDYFFARTINTATTMPHMISLQLRDFQTVEASRDGSNGSNGALVDTKSVIPAPDKPDCIFLLQSGSPGLDGHPSVIHGGVTCALMDETMGLLIMLHHNNIRGPGPRDSLFTANLNVSYRAQVPTPGQYIIKAWVTKREGRKWYSRGHLVDEQGKILVEAQGLWLIAKSNKL